MPSDKHSPNNPHEGDKRAAPTALASRLNWLRAGVLGANDGIVSTAGLVLGVAGASPTKTNLLVAGIAGLISGALSMAAGEYISVSTQRDTEKAAVEQEKRELRDLPHDELEELAELLQKRGLSRQVAMQAAQELTQHNALAAHAEIELGIHPGHYTNPWEAAVASAVAFSLGALVPLGAVLLTPLSAAVWVTVVAVSAALLITGGSSASLGDAPIVPAVMRNVMGGVLAMGVTYGVGRLVALTL